MSVMCRLLGHQPLFCADGRTMRWACERCGQAEGAKDYDTTADAQRYATAFNRRDASNLGKRAPLIGLLPLRLWRMIRRR